VYTRIRGAPTNLGHRGPIGITFLLALITPEGNSSPSRPDLQLPRADALLRSLEEWVIPVAASYDAFAVDGEGA
jgi:hypothetical protein